VQERARAQRVVCMSVLVSVRAHVLCVRVSCTRAPAARCACRHLLACT